MRPLWHEKNEAGATLTLSLSFFALAQPLRTCSALHPGQMARTLFRRTCPRAKPWAGPRAHACAESRTGRVRIDPPCPSPRAALAAT